MIECQRGGVKQSAFCMARRKSMITMGSPYFVWINANKIISSWYLLDAVCVTPPSMTRVCAHGRSRRTSRTSTGPTRRRRRSPPTSSARPAARRRSSRPRSYSAAACPRRSSSSRRRTCPAATSLLSPGPRWLSPRRTASPPASRRPRNGWSH